MIPREQVKEKVEACEMTATYCTRGEEGTAVVAVDDGCRGGGQVNVGCCPGPPPPFPDVAWPARWLVAPLVG